MTQLTHWKKLENPDYIGAYAFQPGEKKTLTVRKVTREIVTGPDNRKEECTIVHWQENEKPLILNATNGKTINKVLGTPYIEQWPGGRVTLAVEAVKAFGEVVDAVRVQKQKPPQLAPKGSEPTPCTDCGEIIQAAGGFAADAIIRAANKKFGVPLCAQCAGARKAAAENTQEESPDENQQNPDQ